MSNFPLGPWPYACKAVIQHEFDTDHLNVWLTFALEMDQAAKPSLDKWLIYVDGVSKAVTASAWQDGWTLLLTVGSISADPTRVLVSYNGTFDPEFIDGVRTTTDLRTTYHKRWNQWGPILSWDYTRFFFSTGMIQLWSGSVASIPTGWHLCDGTEGTPDLRNKFIVGAGNTYAPGATGGTLSHTHTSPSHVHVTTIPSGVKIQSGSGYHDVFSTGTTAVTINPNPHLPPYYALCYIMKL